MIDFTSSLYLGMKHASDELSHWSQLTTGVPAALHEPLLSKQISQYIAQMQGLQKGVSAPSTLHLYYDLFEFLGNRRITLFIDEHVYPISKCGIEKLQVKRVPIYSFRHLNENHLFELVREKLRRSTVPIVITDGWCSLCGKPAPIKNYSKIVNRFGGHIIIDDTQAFGILGERSNNL